MNQLLWYYADLEKQKCLLEMNEDGADNDNSDFIAHLGGRRSNKVRTKIYRSKQGILEGRNEKLPLKQNLSNSGHSTAACVGSQSRRKLVSAPRNGFSLLLNLLENKERVSRNAMQRATGSR